MGETTRGEFREGATCTVNPGKRTMSAAARRKIAAAQRARWAKLRGGRCAVPRRVPAALSRRTGLSEHSARFAHRSWSRGLCRQSRHLCSPLSAWDLVGWQERARLRQSTSERNRFQPLLDHGVPARSRAGCRAFSKSGPLCIPVTDRRPLRTSQKGVSGQLHVCGSL